MVIKRGLQCISVPEASMHGVWIRSFSYIYRYKRCCRERYGIPSYIFYLTNNLVPYVNIGAIEYNRVWVNESGPNGTVAHEGDSSLIQSRCMTGISVPQ